MPKLKHKKCDIFNDFQTLCCDGNWQILNLNFRAKNYKCFYFLQIFFDVLKMTNKEELKHFLGERQCESLARMGYLMNKNDSFSIQKSQKSIFLRILSTLLLFFLYFWKADQKMFYFSCQINHHSRQVHLSSFWHLNQVLWWKNKSIQGMTWH